MKNANLDQKTLISFRFSPLARPKDETWGPFEFHVEATAHAIKVYNYILFHIIIPQLLYNPQKVPFGEHSGLYVPITV